MNRVYLASSWRNTAYPNVHTALLRAGHEVYDFRHPATGFSWTDVDPGWETSTAEQYLELINHPRARAGFEADLAAMKWSDTIVLVLPCGRSAHLELGWGVGTGRRTAVLLSDEEFRPDLMYRMVDHLATTVEGLVGWLAIEEAAA